jgi:aromatic-L-amino-acid/L-tryptophan decarboxylase
VNPFAMDPQTMRSLGYQAVDALVDRWTHLPEGPPWRGASRAELDRDPLFGAPPPEHPSDPAAVMALALERILPVAARVDHPDFLAYIPSAPTWPSVVGDFLATGFNIFQGTWQGGGAPARVELQVLEWFAAWMGMPATTSGLFTSGGSVANALAIAAARDRARRAAGDGTPAAASAPTARATQAGAAQAGATAQPAASPPRLMLYLSDQGHASLARGARMAGFTECDIRTLPTGSDGRLAPSTVREAILADRERDPQARPFLLAANAAATNTGIVDPLDGLAEVARAFDLHFHVDAAYGGFGVLDPRGVEALRGIEKADTVTLDPHKWLFQPFECGCLLARDPSLLEEAFPMTAAAYLHDTHLGAPQVNFSERGIQLTRSFRALKVWMSLQTFGMETFRRAIGQGMDLAERAQEWLEASEVFEVLTPASMGIVTWRVRPEVLQGGEASVARTHRALQDHLADTGTAFLSSTVLGERHALRFCFLNPAATEERLARILERAAAFLCDGDPAP